MPLRLISQFCYPLMVSVKSNIHNENTLSFLGFIMNLLVHFE